MRTAYRKKARFVWVLMVVLCLNFAVSCGSSHSRAITNPPSQVPALDHTISLEGGRVLLSPPSVAPTAPAATEIDASIADYPPVAPLGKAGRKPTGIFIARFTDQQLRPMIPSLNASGEQNTDGTQTSTGVVIALWRNVPGDLIDAMAPGGKYGATSTPSEPGDVVVAMSPLDGHVLQMSAYPIS